ncbi:right-handed parallel beta-helix repeat-containing protein [Anaerolineae bacterium CFX8]|nr:right-handed parallel beta-helix repeat-containing protein [Anaerolineae bacterium CFX8]
MVGRRILFIVLGLLCLTALVSSTFATLPAIRGAGGIVTNCQTFYDGGGVADTLGELLPYGGSILFGCSGTIFVPEMFIQADTTLDGGNQSVTLSGSKTNRLFIVPIGGRLELANLTVIDGYAGPGNGGAINNAGTLVIRYSRLSNHQTQKSNYAQAGRISSGYRPIVPMITATYTGLYPTPTGDWQWVEPKGGTIYNSGSASIINSVVSDGRAYRGGGIYSTEDGRLTITNSSISHNHDTAIISEGYLSIVSSTVDYNDGGAISASGTTVITSSTISYNSNTIGCGGISASGNTTINSSTLAYNSTSWGSWSICGGAVKIANSLIAGLSYSYRGNCSSKLIDLGFNLATDDTCGVTRIQFQQLHLAELADNGGPTMTHALGAGSIAIDAGSCAPGYDQRGADFWRPIDVPLIGKRGNGCDVGAYEVQLPKRIVPVPRPTLHKPYGPPAPTPTSVTFP